MDGKIEQKLQARNSQENEISDQLISYLNGHLTDKERRPIENHLRRCKACQRELEFLTLAKRVQEEDFALAAFAFLKRRA
jgi:anti-sigma factor RsiW